ncbi:helix-turn-helix transcriptional regulator [Natronorubrum sp. DTA7]|uniref:helix-turn-helix transcriptional regulator n=1 Tax=Natronorubrum sp. DTA7 TaxID=3447016 RepID=UPI003F838D40
MRVSTAVTLALTALLVTSLLGVAAATPASSAPEQTQPVPLSDQSLYERSTSTTLSEPQWSLGSPSPTASQSSLESTDPKQVIRISVTETGDATWTIESRFLLTDEDDETAFVDYADEVTSGQRDVSYDSQQFDTFREDAQQATGREMTFENPGWDEPRIVSPEEAGIEDGSLPETDADTDLKVGIISYSFTWTNFATVEGDRIYFGDAMTSFSALVDGQRLVIEPPSGYALDTQYSTTLNWDGPYEFSSDELEIVFVRSGGGGATSSFGIPNWLIAGVVGVVFAVGIGSYLFARRDQISDLPAPLYRISERVDELGLLARLRSGAVARDGADDQGASATDTDGGTAVRSGGAADAVGDGPTSAAGTRLEYEETPDDEIDPQLLSDEERVLRMLTRNGGRMKQASIVKETGWSNAKVSQLLSQMDEDEEIEKLRIGRENLITLPEVDPTELD